MSGRVNRSASTEGVGARERPRTADPQRHGECSRSAAHVRNSRSGDLERGARRLSAAPERSLQNVLTDPSRITLKLCNKIILGSSDHPNAATQGLTRQTLLVAVGLGTINLTIPSGAKNKPWQQPARCGMMVSRLLYQESTPSSSEPTAPDSAPVRSRFKRALRLPSRRPYVSFSTPGCGHAGRATLCL